MNTLIRSLALLLMWALGSAHAATVLSLANVSAQNHPRNLACHHFAEAVKNMSHGRIVVEVIGDASLGDDVAMVKALQDGTLDMTANSQGAVSTVVPEFLAIGMPFLFTSAEQAWQVLDGPVGQELARRAAAKGLIVLGFWDNGIRHISNSAHPIRKPSDVAGLRIRTPPGDDLTADIVAALGGHPQPIRFSEVYNALERGFVDGQENPLVNFQHAKLHAVQKYISLTGHEYEVTPFLISRATWETLSTNDREVLRNAAQQATRYQRELTRKANAEAYGDLVGRGVRIDKVDPAPFAAAVSGVYKKWYASPIGDYVRMVVQAARAQQ